MRDGTVPCLQVPIIAALVGKQKIDMMFQPPEGPLPVFLTVEPQPRGEVAEARCVAASIPADFLRVLVQEGKQEAFFEFEQEIFAELQPGLAGYPYCILGTVQLFQQNNVSPVKPRGRLALADPFPKRNYRLLVPVQRDEQPRGFQPGFRIGTAVACRRGSLFEGG